MFIPFPNLDVFIIHPGSRDKGTGSWTRIRNTAEPNPLWNALLLAFH
jgi:hypothetical protein